MNLKVMFITQEDPIYVSEFWDEFSKNKGYLNPDIEITSIVSLMPLGKKSMKDVVERVYNMYGLVGTFKIGLKYLKAKIQKKDLEYYAKKIGADYIKTTKVHTKEFIDFASKHDLIFSVAASAIFKESLIKAPKFGIVNIHSGPIPNYRGMMPVFWQMRDGKKEIGITIHFINEKIDSGKILVQKFVDISHINTLDEAIRYTKREGAKMVIDFLNNFENYLKNQREVQEEGSYFSFPTRKDVVEFKRKGYKLV